MSVLKKLGVCFASLVLFGVFPVLLNAQYDSGKQDTMAKQDNMAQTMTATGCLKQGSDTGGYYLMGDDGKMYELWGKGLSAHVGHKVTVTGTQATMSQGQEKKREMSEKSEAGGASTVDMKVTNVKMVSETCQ